MLTEKFIEKNFPKGKRTLVGSYNRQNEMRAV